MMMNALFFATLVAYFVATALQFSAIAFKKEGVGKSAWLMFLAAVILPGSSMIFFLQAPL